jgi:hypothetical protein
VAVDLKRVVSLFGIVDQIHLIGGGHRLNGPGIHAPLGSPAISRDLSVDDPPEGSL